MLSQKRDNATSGSILAVPPRAALLPKQPRQVLQLSLLLSLSTHIADVYAYKSLPMKLHLGLRVKCTSILESTKSFDFKVNLQLQVIHKVTIDI